MSENHLAVEYLHEFDLEHLYAITVKREERRLDEITNLLQQEDSYGASQEDRLLPLQSLLSSNETMYQQPIITSMYTDPVTHPDTPASNYPCETPHAEDYWFPPADKLESQPLDLRPPHSMGGEPVSDIKENIPSEIFIDGHQVQHRTHLEYNAKNAPSPRIIKGSSGYSTWKKKLKLDDKLLVRISSRELNRLLREVPMEEKRNIKRDRRTLKNRDYAQSCRSRKLQQKCYLESINQSLQNELRKTKAKLEKIKQERYLLHQQLQMIRSIHVMYNINGNGPNSKEFYLEE